MTTRIIFIYINLLLIIYNSNGFIVDDYAAARQNVEVFDKHEQLKYLKSHLAVIEIIYKTSAREFVRGYVTENSVSILKDLIDNDLLFSILSIKYIYNKKLITLSDFEHQKKRKSNFFTIASSNEHDRKIIDYNIFIRTSTINFLTQTDLIHYTQDKLNQHLHDLKLGRVNDFVDVADSVNKFEFNSIKLKDKWYIFGKVNGRKSQDELIPTYYISNSFYLNTIGIGEGVKTFTSFLSLKKEKFNQDDVGSYLIYLTQTGYFRVFAQITKVIPIKDNVQVLHIHRFNNLIRFNINFKYTKIEFKLVEDGYTLTSISSSSSKVEEDKQQELTQRESNDLGILQETTDELPAAKKSKPNVEDIVTELENFTCGSIITKGEYILKSRNITINVINTEAENFYSNNNGNLYIISGYYTYNSVTKSFTACHSSDDAKGHDDYLVTKEEGGKKFYPNHVLAKKH